MAACVYWGMRRAITIALNQSERDQLERLKRSRRASVRLAERAAIVLHAADGLDNQQIGQTMGISRQIVCRVSARPINSGLTHYCNTFLGKDLM